MLHMRGVARTTLFKICDILLCIFGFIVMAYTTSLTLASWASGDQEPGLPSYCDKKKAGMLP